jgi:hypothetical protein
MRFDDSLDEKEPKPRALSLARRGIVDSVEMFEDLMLLRPGDPDPLV